MRTAFPLAVAAAAALIGAAAVRPRTPPPSTEKITLIAKDNGFSPTTIRVAAGRPVAITLINEGTRVHGLRLVLSYGEVPFPENVPPGDKLTQVINNLGQPGTYAFYCPVDDDAKHGMRGTVIVKPAQ